MLSQYGPYTSGYQFDPTQDARAVMEERERAGDPAAGNSASLPIGPVLARLFGRGQSSSSATPLGEGPTRTPIPPMQGGANPTLSNLDGTSVLSWLNNVGDLGDLFSSGAESSQNGRVRDDFANMNAATANNRARVSVGQFNMDAPLTRAQQVARGDLMAADIPRASISGSGRDVSYVGGVDPSMFGPNTRTAGQTLSNNSLAALTNNADRIEPQLVTPSQAGTGEKIAGGLGFGLNILGTLNNLRRRR